MTEVGVRAEGDEAREARQGGAAFELSIPLSKAWEDEDGDLWFEGVAASTALDRQRERMSKQAIEKMSRCRGLDLLPSHSAGVLQELGTVDECWVDSDEFRVRGRLDRANPDAWRLYERLRAGKVYGLSVGGRVLAAKWQHDAEAGRVVRVIEDVALDHIAVCRPGQAANPETYLGLMAKAAEEGGFTPTSSCCGEREHGEGGLTPRPHLPAGEGGEGEGDGQDGFTPPASLSLSNDAREEDGEGQRQGWDSDGLRSCEGGGGTGEKLAKLGRHVLEVTRALWGGGEAAGDDDGEDGTPTAGDAPGREGLAAQVEALLEKMAGLERDLQKMQSAVDADDVQDGRQVCDGLHEVESGERGGEPQGCESGRKSLDGQERRAGRRAHIWKGVL